MPMLPTRLRGLAKVTIFSKFQSFTIQSCLSFGFQPFLFSRSSDSGYVDRHHKANADQFSQKFLYFSMNLAKEVEVGMEFAIPVLNAWP